MKLSEKQQIFTLNVSLLIAKAKELGIGLTFGDAFRSEDQEYLNYKGLTIKDGVLTASRKKSWTMNSMHLKRLAV